MSVYTVEEAQELGRAAYHDGKVCVPALDEKFLISNLPPIVGEAIPILEAWLRGWTEENLKAEVPG